MHTDMILDMDNFDFSSIMDEDSEVMEQEEAVEEVQHEDNDFSWEREDDVEEEVDFEVEDNNDGADTAAFEESFSSLPDDYEIAIGDARISKKDLHQVVTAKADILDTQKSLDTFCASLMAQQKNIDTFYTVKKTEVEKYLEHIDAVINDDRSTDAQVAAALREQRKYKAQEQELKHAANEARAAIEAQQQQAIQYAVDNTARQVTGGRKAVQQAVQYASSLGINSDALAQSISPELINLVLDAQRYRKQQESNKARVSAAVKGKAPVSAPSKKNVSRQADSRRAAQVNKVKRGELTGADAFAFIVD